ncbi:MAG: Hsp70 family protein, partial [Gammaproteobacteria bacterium]|nr:Hsp70 family protein [Gammaproteobacteria bacterium]
SAIELTLSKPGENTFKVYVFDSDGSPINLENDKIIITRTAANIDAIPASHSIGVEARDKLGGRLVLEYLVKEGDQLPIKGQKIFRTEESLKSGSTGSIKFKLWEGEISDPINDNRFIGMFEIKGSDFDDAVITSGAELVCDYEVLDSGNINLEVTVPSIGGLFHSGRNFYSRQEGQIDYSNASKLIEEESDLTKSRVDEMESSISDPRLDQAREKLEQASDFSGNNDDPESSKQAMDNVQEAKKLLAQTRKDHLKSIRQLELDKAVGLFDEAVREHARNSEESAFDNLARTAQSDIDNNKPDFESHLDDLRSKSYLILWRQDWFVINRFKSLAEHAYLFNNAEEHAALVSAGNEALRANDLDKLRQVVYQLDMMRVGSSNEDEMFSSANIVRGM